MAVTNFIPTVWSETLIKSLDKQYVGIANCTREFEGDIKEMGSVVKICNIGRVNISSYSKNTNIKAPEEIDGDATELAIDRARYFNFQIDDVDRAQATPKLMEEAMNAAAIALANDADYAYIVSNTTEAGIRYNPADMADSPAESFPAKLAQLLYTRYKAGLGGFTILPCELIENNGGELKSVVLRYAEQWRLGNEFVTWINENNRFLNTLVDRIVTGYDESLGDMNPLANTCELYHIWVIEGEDVGIPFSEAGLNVVYTDDLEKYRTRKVRILNGAHTSLIPYALLEGEQTVLDAIRNPKLKAHLEGCLSEVLPTLGGLYTEDELKSYMREVIERFENPYIKHKCSAIALNSISKFKVRCLPSIKAYYEIFGKAPKHLSVACDKLIELYKEGDPCDDAVLVEYIKTHTREQILSEGVVFGEDITKYIAG